jgi:hypothetical protein
MGTVRLALAIAAFWTINAFAQVTPCQPVWTITEKGDSVAFSVVEKMPFLKEGIEPYMKWIKENIAKKLVSRKKEQKKKVYVSFIVDEDRNTVGFMIEKGLGDPYDKEALRLIMNNAQTWIAGQCGNKKVKTRMTIPVAF